MTRNTILVAIMFLIALTVNAQNDTMYIMKSGHVVGVYDINIQIDSVIFYKPQILLDSTITDVDGNVYNIVTIGNQVWMKENLKTTKYNNGTPIPNWTDGTVWSSLNTPSYSWYNNQVAIGNIYGALYNWYAVNTGNLCPTGWHVPTDIDWTSLISYLGGSSIAGGKLKETGALHWSSPNAGASNMSGFTALPSGYRSFNGVFSSIGFDSLWWSVTEYDAYSAWSHGVYYDYSNVYRDYNDKRDGFSVRCVKD